MKNRFHLSIAAKEIEKEAQFLCELLGGTVTHRDPSGYINIDLQGCQITLKTNSLVEVNLQDFHFGFNLDSDEFEMISSRIIESKYQDIVMKPKVIDAGTPIERKKMYLKSPTGYLVELKGYP
ncbi:MAG: hypothetical protein HRU19_17025 [Pseudobacteriovorax sp.]|nr:hypothetical protein [Pseudobacteriovorax sp.]